MNKLKIQTSENIEALEISKQTNLDLIKSYELKIKQITETLNNLQSEMADKDKFISKLNKQNDKLNKQNEKLIDDIKQIHETKIESLVQEIASLMQEKDNIMQEKENIMQENIYLKKKKNEYSLKIVNCENYYNKLLAKYKSDKIKYNKLLIDFNEMNENCKYYKYQISNSESNYNKYNKYYGFLNNYKKILLERETYLNSREEYLNTKETLNFLNKDELVYLLRYQHKIIGEHKNTIDLYANLVDKVFEENKDLLKYIEDNSRKYVEENKSTDDDTTTYSDTDSFMTDDI
jgi:chromosome segregation ATPase